MARSGLSRLPRRGRRPLNARPRLEVLEARWVPAALSALRDLAGFTEALVPRGDDNSSGLVSIGFTLNYFGQSYDQLFVNTNGSVSFAPTDDDYLGRSLETVGIPLLAAYSADVDTSPDDGGTVAYGQGEIDGRAAFAVTWSEVGYFDRKTDKANTFQLVLIDRDDRGDGAFDVELNYAQVQWESGDSTGSGGLNGNPPEVGFTAGTGLPGTFFEAPGSGRNGTLLDGAPQSLVAANPTGTQPGRRLFQARDGGLVDVSLGPVVAFTDVPAAAAAGVEWVAAGRVTGDGVMHIEVDFGDGTAVESVVAAADGRFEVRHVYATQGTRQVVVTAIDAAGAEGLARTRVFVLPGGSSGRVAQSVVEVAAPGETVWPAVEGDEASVAAEYTRSGDAEGEVSVFLALYDGAPLATARQGTFFDIQVGGAADGDEIVVTVSTELLKGAFEFGYFDTATGKWVNLLARPDLAQVDVDAATGTMTVRFRVVNIFDGTVFTVSAPTTTATTTTTTVRGATASAGDTSGLGRAVSFTSNTQLAVALTSSQGSQLAGRSAAQGSQGTAAGGGPSGGQFGTVTSAPPVGSAGDGAPAEGRGSGAAPKAAPIDDAILWQILNGDEALLRLWLQGVDLSGLLAPGDEGELVGAFLPEAVAVVDKALADEAELAAEGGATPAAVAADDDARLAALALAVAGVGAWRREERRAKRRVLTPRPS